MQPAHAVLCSMAGHQRLPRAHASACVQARTTSRPAMLAGAARSPASPHRARGGRACRCCAALSTSRQAGHMPLPPGVPQVGLLLRHRPGVGLQPGGWGEGRGLRQHPHRFVQQHHQRDWSQKHHLRLLPGTRGPWGARALGGGERAPGACCMCSTSLAAPCQQSLPSRACCPSPARALLAASTATAPQLASPPAQTPCMLCPAAPRAGPDHHTSSGGQQPGGPVPVGPRDGVAVLLARQQRSARRCVQAQEQAARRHAETQGCWRRRGTNMGMPVRAAGARLPAAACRPTCSATAAPLWPAADYTIAPLWDLLSEPRLWPSKRGGSPHWTTAQLELARSTLTAYYDNCCPAPP